MGRARFIIYPWFNFFLFVVFSATRRRPPLGRTKDRRESRNLLCFSPKAVETLIYADNVMVMYIFFFVLFIFIHVRFEGNNRYAKKVLSQPWNSLTLQISLPLREKHDKIVFTLQGYFGRSDNLLRSPHIFEMLIRQKLLKHGYKDSVTDISFFIVCEIYFLLVLWKLSIRRE